MKDKTYMLIDPKLRQRILVSLRQLVREAQWRHSQFKGDLENGSQGGYSDELREATQLLQDLEQGTMFCGAEEPRIIAYAEQECVDMGLSIGMSEGEAVEFFLKYGSQGWVLGNGLPIVDLSLAMRHWKLRGRKDSRPDTQTEYAKLKDDGEL